MSQKYSFRLTEELARWTFEVLINQNKDWYIGFTNPTAGPWKKVTAIDLDGIEGEVHRFARDEERPDLLLLSDKYKIILIIEAKDSLPKLIKDKQIKKSAQVVLNLARTLKNKNANLFWGERSSYTIVAGLLWGSELPSTEQERQKAFNLYSDGLKNNQELCSDIIIGIESFKDTNDGITCSGYVSRQDDITSGINGKFLLETLTVLTQCD